MDHGIDWLKSLWNKTSNIGVRLLVLFCIIFLFVIIILGALTEANLLPKFIQDAEPGLKFGIIFLLAFLISLVWLAVYPIQPRWIGIVILLSGLGVGVVIGYLIKPILPANHQAGEVTRLVTVEVTREVIQEVTVPVTVIVTNGLTNGGGIGVTSTATPQSVTGSEPIIRKCMGMPEEKLDMLDVSSKKYTLTLQSHRVHNHYGFRLDAFQMAQFYLSFENMVNFRILDATSCAIVFEDILSSSPQTIPFNQRIKGEYFIEIEARSSAITYTLQRLEDVKP